MGSEDLAIRSLQRQRLEDLLSAGNADCRFAANVPGRFVGTATNDDAPAGDVGEVLSTTVAPATVSLTSTTAANVASVALTPGDWDVSGVVNYTPNAITSVTVMSQGASATTATLGAQDTYSTDANAAEIPGANVITKVIPTQRFKLASLTTVYLVALAVFTANTLTAGGTIRARRMR